MSNLTFAAVIGSLKAASVNRAVFNAAAELMPEGVTLVEASITDVPLFSEDIEAAGDPARVTALKGAVDAADGLLIFTPEYNRSIPGVTKNAVDWLSRPFMAGPIFQKPTGIAAASPGGGDAPGSRAHLAQAAAGAGATVFDESFGIASIYNHLTDGALSGADLRTELAAWLERYVAFVRESIESQ